MAGPLFPTRVLWAEMAQTKMRYKLLGKTGLRVSELCLGAGTFGTNWGTLGSDKDESKRIFDAFVQAGGNFLDTSNRYQEGMSEEILGELIRENRDFFVLGSKYSLYDTFAMMNDPNASGNHRKNMIRSVESSLRRLRTDYIDLLWVHMWDFTTPVEEVARGLDDLVRSGKIHYIGFSNVPAWVAAQFNTLADLRGWSRFNAMQIEYSLVERTPEREFTEFAKAFDVAITSWSPLAGGLVTGKYNKGMLEPGQPHRIQKPLDPKTRHVWYNALRRNLEIMEGVVKLADEVGRPAVQLALNWLRAKNVIPIFSARTLAQAQEDLACLDWQLTAEQVNRIDEATRRALTEPVVEKGYPHDFYQNGSPAIPDFPVLQMLYGFVGKQIENHREVPYPGGVHDQQAMAAGEGD
jgi:aryl-alcohol dehydrogenase-like predicted oxidoreductase